MVRIKVDDEARKKAVYKLITNGYGRILRDNIFEIPEKELELLDEDNIPYKILSKGVKIENPIRDTFAAGI